MRLAMRMLTMTVALAYVGCGAKDSTQEADTKFAQSVLDRLGQSAHECSLAARSDQIKSDLQREVSANPSAIAAVSGPTDVFFTDGGKLTLLDQYFYYRSTTGTEVSVATEGWEPGGEPSATIIRVEDVFLQKVTNKTDFEREATYLASFTCWSPSASLYLKASLNTQVVTAPTSDGLAKWELYGKSCLGERCVKSPPNLRYAPKKSTFLRFWDFIPAALTTDKFDFVYYP